MKTIKTMIVVARELIHLYGAREGIIRIALSIGLFIKSQIYPKGVYWTARMHACNGCSLYSKHYETCGTPGESFEDPATEKLESLGCWCIMREAARLPKKDCWARARGLDIGWPDNLRPKL